MSDFVRGLGLDDRGERQLSWESGTFATQGSRAVSSLIECSTIEEASREVGVSRSTLYEWLKVPVFQEEYERAKRRKYHAGNIMTR